VRDINACIKVLGRHAFADHALLTTALLALFTGLTGFLPGARAEDYPGRPVRLITDSAPGSAIDVPVRLIAEGLSRIWGQQLIGAAPWLGVKTLPDLIALAKQKPGELAVVINQPGAGGAIAARSATTAAPDGYTFGVMALSAFVALPGMADNLPVAVPRDAIPVGYLGGAPMLIGAAPWLGVKTLPDLIALAKQKPGELSYGVNGIGRLTHLTGELLQRQANIKLLMVPYTGGTPQIINDMMGKQG
jgi:tripartite-type tricarboxylate transporter receptor subunit TctC